MKRQTTTETRPSVPRAPKIPKTLKNPGKRATKQVVPKPTAEAGPIIWSLDPTGPEDESLKGIASSIKAWVAGGRNPLIPVSILSPVDFSWRPTALWKGERRLLDGVGAALRAKISKHELRGAPQVLFRNSPFLGQTVQALLDFATKEKASLIAVNTRAKKGLAGLGSFTETLISESKIPVLAVNPRTKAPKAFSTILFATDLSESSREAFASLLGPARRWGARVVIFHHQTPPPAFLADPMTGATFSVPVPTKEENRERREQAAALVSSAKAAGLEADLVLSRGIGPTHQKILKVAKRERADLIAVTTHLGRAGQIFLGSVSREVLIAAKRPVMVFHG